MIIRKQNYVFDRNTWNNLIARKNELSSFQKQITDVSGQWLNEESVRQWSGRPGFNPIPKTKKNGTWCHLA